MSEQEKPQKSEKPEKIIDDIVTRLDDMHRSLVDGATYVGYARDAFRTIRPMWVSLGNSGITDPVGASIYASAVNFLSAFRDEVRAQQSSVIVLSGLLQQTSGSVVSFINASGATASFIPNVSVIPFSENYVPFPSPDLHKSYAERFSRFDQALGKTYQEIWEALYGTRADPERGALYLVRQAFDHLFDKLAPDDEVRRSSYWTQKERGKENQVWREERIRFAAAKHIKDQGRSNTLIASAKHMTDVYEGLNRAHERGGLNQMKARQALAEMRSILEEWADAIGI